jgi:tRNA threonylcarbamoyladenosine biosynthesis protein TsaE
MSQFTFTSPTADTTRKLGYRIGAKLEAGDILLLNGDLGAGKTTFSQGIGSALGVEEVTSPTFVISKIYHGVDLSGQALRLMHLDLYRINEESAGVFDDLDIESYLLTSAVIIEWGDKHISRLSENYLEINVIPEGSEIDSPRAITFNIHGDEVYVARWNSSLTQVKASFK